MQRLIVMLAVVVVLAAGGYAYFQTRALDVPQTDDRETGEIPREDPGDVYEGPDDEIVFTRLEIDTASDTPEACLVFSEALDDSGDVNYEDYMAIEPATKPSLRVDGPLLCLGGLEFNERYQVTLREGLPAASGNLMPFDEVVPVELRDRPPVAAFGGGVILPRHSGGGLPITTVNIDTLDIRVMRVGERMIARLREGLIDSDELYSYEIGELENDQGALIWQGEMEVDAELNQSVRTVFPLRDILTDQEPGAFLILAEDARERTNENSYWSGTAAQWVIETNIGLTTFQGDNGIRVFARGLDSAEALPGITLALVARNNEILGELTTGANGTVHFDGPLTRGEGGMEPVAVMASADDGDFAFLDLRRAAFDLSDRGVSGRAVAGPVDAFLYTDRGIYRPGETVQLVTLLRDRRADALDDVPLTLVVRRPDGVEVSRETYTDQDAGALHTPIDLSRTAPRGHWSASVYIDTNAAPVGRAYFEVQDFVPERLEVIATPENEVLLPGDRVEIDVTARFLYGAPAGNMAGEAELRLTRDPHGFAGYEDFTFGRVEERLDAQLWALDMPPTDARGATVATTSLANLPASTAPLRGTARIAVFEPGGRATQTTAEVRIRTQTDYIGIRPTYDGRYVRRGSEAGFEVVSLNDAGERTAMDAVHWELVREVRHYQWYEVDGRWRYERIVRDRPVNAGTLSTSADELAEITDTLDWGTYRLMLEDADGRATASVRFYVGYWGATSEDTPDHLVVTSEAGTYAQGETAQVTIMPSEAGPASIVIATDRIIDTMQVDVPAEGLTVDLNVTEEWGAGAYVLVTHYRPLGEGDPRSPVRSVGLTWLEVDHSDRILDIALDAPEVVTPQQQITVPVHVENTGGERVYLTLAAVDQGILQLTRFDSPNPEDYYFGKRRLGVDMLDDYGRLITDTAGAFGDIRTGGDNALGGAGLTVVPTRTVALFSGLVELDRNGNGEVTLDIPDFAGELRLMAVAVSSTKVGQTDQPLTIRDALVGELTLPRFLAPRDEAQATLSMHNVDGAAGEYRAAISVEGPVTTPRDAISLRLGDGERQERMVPFVAISPGIATITMDLTGPDGFERTRSWQIEVRPSQRPETTEEVILFGEGETYSFRPTLTDGLIPSTARVSGSFSTTRGFDTAGLIRALDRYPYGCLEQTVSRALPLLYLGDLAETAGLTEDEDLDVRLQNAVNRVLDMQRSNGAFGMWGYNSAEAEAWLSLYATEFLTEAKDQGLIVPNDALRRSYEWVRGVASQSWRENELRAYAFYLLAQRGDIVPGDLRYFHDTGRAGLTDIMALAHLGAALDAIGDRSRASATFDQAMRLANEADPRTYEAQRYGSLLRDVAGLTAMAGRSERLTLLPALFGHIAEMAPRLRYTTTQEKAWLLFAAQSLQRSGIELDVTIEGVAAMSGNDPLAVAPTSDEMDAGVSAANNGVEVWRTVSVTGVPNEPQPADANGFSLTRSFHNPDGSLADLSVIQQNDRVIVIIRGRMEDNYFREMGVMDILPAGFEIETTLANGQYPWLPSMTYTSTAEARDDRYIGAFNIGARYRPNQPDSNGNPILPPFAVGYIARAVTPGTYVLPPAYVEDMYRPEVTARTDMGTLTITRAE